MGFADAVSQLRKDRADGVGSSVENPPRPAKKKKKKKTILSAKIPKKTRKRLKKPKEWAKRLEYESLMEKSRSGRVVKEEKKPDDPPLAPGPLIRVRQEPTADSINVSALNLLKRPAGFLEGLTKTNGEATKLYDYQIAHLENENKFRLSDKSRQIGFSFGCVAGEALAKSQLRKVNTSIFISYNQEEANEKIQAVKMLYESIPAHMRKRRVVDNAKSQIFVDRDGNKTRIFSIAQRPPRGKGHNTDVYMDEFAFWTYAEKIFIAAAPVTTRGTGVLTIGSTPLGSKGMFHEILTNKRKFGQFSRQWIPWWHCPDLCTNIKEAFKLAPHMETEQRVYTYGSDNLVLLYQSMPIDGFQQEYELKFVDENVSYIPPEIVSKCVYYDIDEFSYDEIENDEDRKSSIVIDKAERSPIEQKYKKVEFFCCKAIEQLMAALQAGRLSPNLYAGYDVGRQKDKSELTIIEDIQINSKTSLQVVRFVLQLDRKMFEEQKRVLRFCLDNLPIRKMGIDSQNLGHNLAEDLSTEYPGRIELIPMEGVWKMEGAQRMKIRFENQTIAIPDDNDLRRQISSIKKKVTETGYVTYHADKNKEHHGDKFWSLCLASFLGFENKSKDVISNITAHQRIISTGVDDGRVVSSAQLKEAGLVSGDAGRLITIPGEGVLPSVGSLLGPPSPIGDVMFGSSSWPHLKL